MPTLPLNQLTLRPCRPVEIYNLRWRILRFGLPRSEAEFPGDDLPTSHHFAAFEPAPTGETAVCCATFMRADYETQPAWQLRGMATDAGYQGKGVGTALLQLAEQTIVEQADIRLLWCNARIGAIQFYQRQGWQIVSERFDIPTAGPHHKMLKRV